VVNRWENAQIWRNTTEAAGNAILLRLAQEGPNVNAIGAVIEVKTADGVQRREITSGGGHVSGQSGWIHFGLGSAGAAEVRVRWPDSGWGATQTIEAGSLAILDRAAAAPRLWQPPR